MTLPRPFRRCALLCPWIGCLMVAWLACVSLARADGPRFNEDGFLLIEGRPRLILGFYELPKEEKSLEQLAESGFNLVRVSNRAQLDRVDKHGMFGWRCLNVAMNENDPAGRKRIADVVNESKDHPALLVWELPDEALWNVWYRQVPWATNQRFAALRKQIDADPKASPEEKQKRIALLRRAKDLARRALWAESEAICDRLGKQLGVADPRPDAKLSLCAVKSAALAERMARGCDYLRSLDPNHVIWQNHAPRNSIASLQRFNAAVDAAGCDIYPVPLGSNGHSDLSDRTLSSVGAYTTRMAHGAPGKAVWMVLQGFGWRDLNKGPQKHPDPNHGRRPRWHETRFMAYDALMHGAGAILYWGTSYIEKDSPLWTDLMRVGRELRALEPGLVGQRPEREPVAVADESYGSIDPEDAPRLRLRRAGDDWVLIALNRRDQPVAFTVSGLPAELEGKTLYRLGSEETLQVENAQFHDGLPSWGVQVYATSRRFEAKPKGK